jgi:hypothetical protein
VKSRGRVWAIESLASAEAAGEAGSGTADMCNEAFECLRKEREGDAEDRRAKKDGSRLRRLICLSEMLEAGEWVGVSGS